LLTELLAGTEPKVVQDITQKDRRQPRLKLALTDSKQSSSDIRTRNVKLQIEVSEAAAGAKDVRLFRNGSLVTTWRGDVLKGQAKATLDAIVPIVAGEDRLTAYAFNRDNVKSADATLIIKGAASLKREGTAYVLAVGIDEYAHPDYTLRYAVADAKAFGA